MNTEQALKVISEVCAKYVGTLQEHQIIQQALELLKKATEEQKKPIDKEKK